MRPIRVLAAIGDMCRIFTFALIVPFIAAWVWDPYDLQMGPLAMPSGALVFLLTAGLLCLFWLAAMMITREHRDEDLQDKEAYLTVGVGWLVLTAFAMVPFIASGALTNPVDAFFEAMSGLTTTGATVIDDIEGVAPSVLLWRGLLQYLGGMGIIVLSVALLARLTQGGLQLLQAETPGPSVTRVRPKLAQTAKTLWLVYAIISGVLLLILFAMFMAHGMAPMAAAYDALLHTFTTLSTGGFSNHTESIAYYDSWLIEGTIVLFMLIAGSNFTLHYYLLHGDWRRLVKDPEWRFFMGSFVFVTLTATGLLWHHGARLVDAFRGASFTVASIGTSTGYTTVDFDMWPDSLRMILVVLMITGATAGSTSGGMKHIRILLLMKIVHRQIRLLQHPRAIIPIRLGGRVLKEETLSTSMAFFFAFLTLTMIGCFVVTATDSHVDLISGAAGAASMMGNTGPSLGEFGATETFAALQPSSKLIYAMMMWFGRLEVFAALLLFNPDSWKS